MLQAARINFPALHIIQPIQQVICLLQDLVALMQQCLCSLVARPKKYPNPKHVERVGGALREGNRIDSVLF
jgi:hypothetical protein